MSLMVAVLAVLAIASCSKESFKNADEAVGTLSVKIPEAIATKAYGDGKFADKQLIIGVFDENGVEKFRHNYVWGTGKFESADNEIKIRFVMGKKYQLVLWAQYGEAYGNPVDMKLDKIKLDYKASNQENLDAFYAHVPTFTVKEDFEKSITLTRPFAQLNFATTLGDMDESIADADMSGLVAESVVTIKNIANTLDLFTGKTSFVKADGTVAADDEPQEVVIPATAFPTKDANGNYPTLTIKNADGQDEIYEVISMNYILVNDSNAAKEGENAGKTTVDIKFEVGELVINIPGAHMKRNWKTNVVGELLTAEGSFKVSILPDFTDSYTENWNQSIK